MAALDVDFYILKNVFWQVRTHFKTNYGPFLLIHVDRESVSLERRLIIHKSHIFSCFILFVLQNH